MTFLFTDIEGSTALLKRLGGGAYAAALADHHRLVRAGLVAHEGKEIGTQGDGFFAVFTSPSAAVTAVIEMQRSLHAHDWPAGEQVRVRMGVHSGEASETGTGLVGFEVHRAARIAAVAHGGQVVLSATTVALIRDSLPGDATLRDLGSHRLKDLGRPEQIFQLHAEGLEVDFPPLRSLDNAELGNNLPQQLTSFVGRETERAAVRALLEKSRLVTLTGVGGVGKSRLAIQLATDLIKGYGNSVWLVELAPLSDAAMVPQAMARVLSIREEPSRPALDTVVDALRDRNLLVVLDNCEHLIAACAEVANAALRSCPGIVILATSREPIGIEGEQVYRVPSLTMPSAGSSDAAQDLLASEAVRLFVGRATAQDPTFVLDEANAAAVASICRRLDGIPLALELAAARLRAMSVTEIAEHLGDRFRLLTVGSRTALPRQQTLQTLIDWSYRLLSDRERTVLARLSVFAGGFDLRAAEEVAGAADVEAFAVLDVVGSLVDKSLVQAEALPTGKTRYRLLETIREYAAARLAATGAEERDGSADRQIAVSRVNGGGDASGTGVPDPFGARWRHATYYLSLVEDLAPSLRTVSQLEALDRLDPEIDNVRAALETLRAHDSGGMLRLLVALGWYWVLRGHLHESSKWYELAPIDNQDLDPDLRATLTTVSALAQVWDGALDVGSRTLSDLAQLAPQCRNRARWEGWALALAADAAADERGVDRPIVREAIERMRLCADSWEVGAALTILGELERESGQVHTAERLYREARQLFERDGDRLWLIITDLNLAECAVQLDAYEAAIPILASFLFALKDLGNEYLLAYCSIVMGCAETGLEQSRPACLLLGSGLGWLERRGMQLQQREQIMATKASTSLRATLGDEAFQRAVDSGRLRRPDQAIEEFLGKGLVSGR
ncbi:MAG: adenylate/guanylate cyclase domain-containing protein [Acidimicrobiales bacterium]